MLSRFIVPFLLLLFFSFPACGGQNQPETIQKQPLADSSPSLQQQAETTGQEMAPTPPPDQVPDENNTEEEPSDLDDEHG